MRPTLPPSMRVWISTFSYPRAFLPLSERLFKAFNSTVGYTDIKDFLESYQPSRLFCMAFAISHFLFLPIEMVVAVHTSSQMPLSTIQVIVELDNQHSNDDRLNFAKRIEHKLLEESSRLAEFATASARTYSDSILSGSARQPSQTLLQFQLAAPAATSSSSAGLVTKRSYVTPNARS